MRFTCILYYICVRAVKSGSGHSQQRQRCISIVMPGAPLHELQQSCGNHKINTDTHFHSNCWGMRKLVFAARRDQIKLFCDCPPAEEISKAFGARKDNQIVSLELVSIALGVAIPPFCPPALFPARYSLWQDYLPSLSNYKA